ncbi:hypothetical protein GN244_ATG10705 [Phytophthora infestans]|uniref:Uncharacterized protein n=1 Tax=Phytophthora infestans TaxID=4787 RepID=A0A833SRV3_PHYIN|nr:hypothetical protein GN244_ATG10705 [Phytophthora infestans]
MIEGNRTPNDPSAIFLFCHRHQTLRSLDVPFVKLSVGHAMAKKNEQIMVVTGCEKCFSTFSKLMSASRLRVTWEEWCLK